MFKLRKKTPPEWRLLLLLLTLNIFRILFYRNYCWIVSDNLFSVTVRNICPKGWETLLGHIFYSLFTHRWNESKYRKTKPEKKDVKTGGEFQLKTISLVYIIKWVRKIINPLSANPTKWLNTLRQFIDFGRRIVWVCWTILWGWCLKGQGKNDHILSGKPALGAAILILILLHVPLK